MVVSTLLTLYLVPAVFVVLERLRGVRAPAREAAIPAGSAFAGSRAGAPEVS
jgi:hypothetical protein